ncbi:MAG TPA: hypothetical protein PKL84_19350, partial [Candidatus Hydrogenedentes bacterium]|nr:hypothetical protein [Candidatus Hydrogenedentota bacterium]
QFIGNQVTRTIEQVLRDVASGDRVTLLGRETGTYAVDETVEPHRMDIIGIQRTAYPSQVAFGGAAALLDMPADEVQTFFDEALGITFQPKGVYEKSGEVLRLRFGSAAEYPPDLEGGVVIRVERAGWFVKMLEWGTLAL